MLALAKQIDFGSDSDDDEDDFDDGNNEIEEDRDEDNIWMGLNWSLGIFQVPQERKI